MKNTSLLYCLLGILIFPSQAIAHQINLFCYYQDGALSGEVYFSGRGPAKNALIKIYALNNNTLILTDQTDQNGKFHIRFEMAQALKIIANSGGGHQAEVIIDPDKSHNIEKSIEPSPPRTAMIPFGLIVISGIFALIYKMKKNYAP